MAGGDPVTVAKGLAEVRLTDLELGKVIGSSGQAIVYSGQWKSGNAVSVAIKRRPMASGWWNFEEVELMVPLKHPNIISFYGTTRNASNVYIVTELAENGSLQDIYHQDSKLEQKLKWATQIAEGMKYLHQMNVLHRNLKPANVLFMGDWTVKLCDLSAATKVDSPSEIGPTSRWMSPETVTGDPTSFKSDVYSYGITLWQLITCEEPFADIPHTFLPMRIVQGDRPDIPDSCELYLADLMRRCWDPNPEARPIFEEIISVLNRRELL